MMKTPENPSDIIPGQNVVVKFKVPPAFKESDLEGIVQSGCDVVGYATIIVRIFGREVPLAVEWTKIRIKQ
jgi:hypothetical protein